MSATRLGKPVTPTWAAWLLPSLGGVIAAYAFFHGLFPAAAWLFARDGDVGRHIRVGSYILETRSIPRVDLFSHTMRGTPFVPYEWLSELLYAGAHRAAGLAGVTLLAAILFAATCTLVYWTIVRLGVGRPLAFAAAFVSLALQNSHFLPRPHLFTTLLAAIVFALLLEHRRSGRPGLAWAIPPLVLLWANLHGGFLIAFMLLAVFLADAAWQALADGGGAGSSRLRTLGLVSGASLLACMVNPAGPEILAHTTGYLRAEYLVDGTQEYQSPDFHEPADQLFLAVLLLGAALALFGRARVRFLEGTLYLLWAAASLYSARNIPIFAVVALPGIAGWASRTVRTVAEDGGGIPRATAAACARWADRISRTDADLGRPVALAVVLLALAALALSPSGRARYRFSPEVFPVEALQAAREAGVRGPVFNQFIWGGYLLYAAYPEIPVFIDGQTDFYGEKLTREYMRAIGVHEGWDEVLDRYGIAWTMVETRARLNQALALAPGWRLLHRDSTATIYLRER
ncbi:MAG: hypothetical protein ACE5JR_09000 [Gemmatimonadota bacterium]